jgi:UDP-glucose 4-epimerase
MNVLITGGAGFIGSHLAEALLAAGHRVTVADDLSTGSAENLAALTGRREFRFVRESVCNETGMTPLVDRCEVVYHLAAAVGVRLIVDRPVETIETNIHGAEVVLRLASKYGRKVLVASSSEVYGKGSGSPFGEDDDVTLGATRCRRWLYACSKMVDEFLALAHHEQSGLPAVACRLFNTIGPRQTGQYGMVVPRFVRWALRGEPLCIHGTGEQSRCFCHVADAVAALTALMDCPAAEGQVVNVGSDERVTINELADRVIALAGSASTTRHLGYEEAYGRAVDDLPARQPDLRRLRRLIDYAPRHTLDDTLEEIIAYERSRR